MWCHALVLGTGMAAAGPALAGDADVIGVQAIRVSPGVYSFAVTVRSKDTGWERYADRLEALGPDGRVIATRILDHPHDDEQPFTRDISAVKTEGAGPVTTRAHFKPSGFDGATKLVTLPVAP